MKTRILTAFAVAAILLFSVIVLAEDLRSNIMPKASVSPDNVVSNNDNVVGAIVDRLGYSSVTYIIYTGTLADADVTLTPTIQECALDNCADAATASLVLGTVAGATFAATDDNTVKSIGYNGVKRYTRLVLTPANNTGSARVSVVCILGHKQYGPAQ